MDEQERMTYLQRSAQSTSLDEFAVIQDYRRKYYQSVFAGALAHDIADLVNETTIMNWRNPNHSVGSNQIRSKQSFSNAQVMIATRDSEKDDGSFTYEGHAFTATNVSSGRDGLFGLGVRAAKLYTPLGILTNSRYCAVRELIGSTPEVVANLLDRAEEESDELPVRVYVFEAEEMVIDTLQQIGLVRNPDFVNPSADLRSRAFPGSIALQCYIPAEQA